MSSDKLPLRINAPLEQMATAMFRPEPAEPKGGQYECSLCRREIAYPDILHDDGTCGDCNV